MSYTPQPGTVAFRAIAHLETLPRGAELMTSALAEAIGCDGKNVVPSLEAALASGLVFRRQRDNHARSPMWWSLVDHGARPKVDIRKPAVPKWSPKQATGLDDALAQIKADDIAIPRFGAPAPRGTAATSGDGHDDESNGGRARGLAGGSDDGGSQHRRLETGEQVNGAAEHDAGLLRAQPPRAAHQGDAEHAGLIQPEGAAAIAGRAERPKETTQRGAARAHAPSCAARAGDDAKPAVGAAAPEGFRCALWSNGTLQIERSTVAGAAELVLLSRDETRQLVAYLDSICLDVVRGEDDAC